MSDHGGFNQIWIIVAVLHTCLGFQNFHICVPFHVLMCVLVCLLACVSTIPFRMMELEFI